MKRELDVVGHPTPLITGKEKVIGTAVFVRDMKVPHMLYAQTVKTTHPHAKILSVDPSEALKLPGVVDYVTGTDIPHNDKAVGSGGDMDVFTMDKSRFIGDEIGAIVAVDMKTAEKACALVKVEYEPLPVYATLDEGIHPEVDIQPKPSPQYVVSGDMEQGFKEADFIVEDTYYTQTIEHCPSDTESTLADWNGSAFTVWCNSQVPYWDRMMMSRIFKIPQSKIRIVVPCNGAPVGGRNVYRQIYIAAACAWKVRRPVMMVRTREEEFAVSSIRTAYKFTMKFGAKKDGTLTAMECHGWCNSGAYIGWTNALGQAQGHLFSSLYRCPNLYFEFMPVFTNNNWSSPMRSFGNEEINFAMESTMDQLLKKLNMDPVEFRLKNAVYANYVTSIGWQIQGCGLQECIQKANDMIRKDFKPSEDPNIVRSIGCACGVHWTGWRVGFNSYIWRTNYATPEALYAADKNTPYVKLVDGKPQWRDGFYEGAEIDNDRSSASVTVNEEGSVLLNVSDPDLGQGTYTAMAMICAEVLGLDVSDIKVTGADTDAGVYGFGTYSSRVTFVAGRAVIDAATKIRNAMADIAAKELDVPADRLEFRHHKIYDMDDPSKSMYFGDVAFRSYATRDAVLLSFKGQCDPGSIVPDADGHGSIAEAYPFLCQAVEIELNKETGEYKVLRVATVHDSGRIINPSAAEGQVHGALIMGLSLGASEELVRKDGRVMNPNFTNYHPIQMSDVPDIKVDFVQQEEPSGPFGAKGLGEPAVVCMPGAIANAIENAVGVRIKSLPITPAKVLGELSRKNEKDAAAAAAEGDRRMKQQQSTQGAAMHLPEGN